MRRREGRRGGPKSVEWLFVKGCVGPAAGKNKFQKDRERPGDDHGEERVPDEDSAGDFVGMKTEEEKCGDAHQEHQLPCSKNGNAIEEARTAAALGQRFKNNDIDLHSDLTRRLAASNSRSRRSMSARISAAFFGAVNCL